MTTSLESLGLKFEKGYLFRHKNSDQCINIVVMGYKGIIFPSSVYNQSESRKVSRRKIALITKWSLNDICKFYEYYNSQRDDYKEKIILGSQAVPPKLNLKSVFLVVSVFFARVIFNKENQTIALPVNILRRFLKIQ